MIYASSSCIEDCRLIDSVLERYEQLGIKNVELGSSHKYLPDMPEIVKKYGFNYILHNYFPPPKEDFILNLASADKKIFEASIAQIKTSIDFAVAVKSKFVSFHAGFSEDPDMHFKFGLKHVNPMGNVAALERFIKSLKILEEYAKKREVMLAVENNVVAGHNISNGFTPLLMATATECEKVFSSVNSPYLGMLLDIAHLNVSAYNLKFDRDDFVLRTRDFVKELHIHENNSIADQHLGLHSSNDSWFEATASSFRGQKGIYFTLESSNLKKEDVVKNLEILKSWVH